MKVAVFRFYFLDRGSRHWLTLFSVNHRQFVKVSDDTKEHRDDWVHDITNGISAQRIKAVSTKM